MTDNNLCHHTTTQTGAVLSQMQKMEEKLEKRIEKMERTWEAGIKERKKGIFVLQILVAVLVILAMVA